MQMMHAYTNASHLGICQGVFSSCRGREAETVTGVENFYRQGPFQASEETHSPSPNNSRLPVNVGIFQDALEIIIIMKRLLDGFSDFL